MAADILFARKRIVFVSFALTEINAIQNTSYIRDIIHTNKFTLWRAAGFAS